MKKNTSFYVVYPLNEELADLLNLLKIIADDTQRTAAHITVRGPYVERRLSDNIVKKYSDIIYNQVLNISKVDNFFTSNQNTVFFSCDYNEKLKAIWKKSTYNQFNPHVTIYDGDDRDFALKLYEVLSNGFRPFKYRASKLSLLQPSGEIPYTYLKTQVINSKELLRGILNNDNEPIDFKLYSKELRLHKIHLIAKRLYENGF